MSARGRVDTGTDGKARHVGGRTRPKTLGPHFKARNYLNLSTLPTSPDAVDYTSAALVNLHNIAMNNALGCCTISGIAHLEGIFTGNGGTGQVVTFSDDQVIDAYSRACGYVRGNPATDQGGDEVTVLNDWVNNGGIVSGQHKILGWLLGDAKNPVLTRACIWLFGNAYWGFELPDACTHPFPSGDGFTWDAAGDPNPNDGHCVISGSYDKNGPGVDTWGDLGTMTDAFCAKYGDPAASGQVYHVITLEWLVAATKKAPSGFDMTQLLADFDSMGGNVVWTPPTPQPVPAAGQLPTQALVEAAIAAGIKGAHSVMTDDQAIAAANGAIEAAAFAWPTWMTYDAAAKKVDAS